MKTLIFLLLFLPSIVSAAWIQNSYTGKKDYYEPQNSLSNPSAYRYFDADTYIYFDGYQLFTYINGILVQTLGTADKRDIWYGGRMLTYGGRYLSR